MAETYYRSYREAPAYEAPTWDQGAVDNLTQQRAAPGLRSLRQQVNRAAGANYENPNVKRMTLRDALAGYGSGLSSVMGSASSAAANEYGNRFSAESANARTKWESGVKSAEEWNSYQEDLAVKNYSGGGGGSMSEDNTSSGTSGGLSDSDIAYNRQIETEKRQAAQREKEAYDADVRKQRDTAAAADAARHEDLWKKWLAEGGLPAHNRYTPNDPTPSASNTLPVFTRSTTGYIGSRG
jgi:hypothetical protein